ncbi:MAG: hypothetical protein NC201_05835 [Prevotella sp.]|nr:hypothetical protein [Bacteroides sp.]MCM1366754.1 hypothetical protein [Prevotella sp.]MCM1437373.1 hypothetical protein [Prevotella sp.]
MSESDILNQETDQNTTPKKHCCKTSCPRGKWQAFNWLDDVSSINDCEFVQVQFKNTRNGFFTNPAHLDLKIGDIVAVEASPGHDIGEVAMVGPLVRRQMLNAPQKSVTDCKKIFRIARQADIDKYNEAIAREHDTMIQSRRIAEELGLDMKIGDVEYQGDGGKAIFYYIADERVDFRKLIRILADTFHVRIEMKQIGARQEAGRIGGIGPCGRPLCCSSWMNHFNSVGTSAARFQDLSMNPQKLAGQCAKLKCCLNFEVDTYMEASRKLPSKEIQLTTKDATYFFFKADILKHEVTYSTDKNIPANLVTIPAKRAFEIIALNKQGINVDELDPSQNDDKNQKEFIDSVGEDSLTRFDKSKKKKKKKPTNNNKEPLNTAKALKDNNRQGKKNKNTKKSDNNKLKESSEKNNDPSPKKEKNYQKNYNNKKSNNYSPSRKSEPKNQQ